MSELSSKDKSLSLKKCNDCKQTKSVDEFPTFTRTRASGKIQLYHRNMCEICRKKQIRDYGLIYKYGLSLEQYLELERKQNGTCAICNGKCPTGKALAVDHCHKTGKVRGLLCVRCNQALGHLEDSSDTIKNMLNYIETSNE